MTKTRKRKTVPAKARTKTSTKKAAPARKKKAPKAKPLSQLRGFARLAVTDPDRLKSISAKAGRKAQKLFGKKVRWSAAKARRLASSGGKAAQKAYRKTGHPWAADSPLRPKVKVKRARTDRRKAGKVTKRKPRTLPGSKVQAAAQATGAGVTLIPQIPAPVPEQDTPIVPGAAEAEDDGLDSHGQPRTEDLV